MKIRSALTIVSMVVFTCVLGNCATPGKYSAAPSIMPRIDLASALMVKAGTSTKAEVESLFGAPDTSEVKNGREKWTYFLPNTESQRLTVTFGQSASVVESVLWVPREISERKLYSIQSMFPNVKFHTIEPEQNQHYVVSDITYVDQERRILILSQKNSDHADAVAWKAPESRSPSAKP